MGGGALIACAAEHVTVVALGILTFAAVLGLAVRQVKPDELLDDLDARLAIGIERLTELAESTNPAWRAQRAHIEGKRQGLALVRDWLRSYR